MSSFRFPNRITAYALTPIQGSAAPQEGCLGGFMIGSEGTHPNQHVCVASRLFVCVQGGKEVAGVPKLLGCQDAKNRRHNWGFAVFKTLYG